MLISLSFLGFVYRQWFLGVTQEAVIFKKRLFSEALLRVFLWPLWVPSNLRRFFNQNYVSYILGSSRTSQSNPLWSKGVVTWSLACSHSLRAGLTLGKNRGEWALRAKSPHSQPHRALRLLVLLGPGCLNTATAPPGTGHLPRSHSPRLLCPAAALLGRHSLLPAPVSPVPRSKCPDCVSRDLAPSHSCALFMGLTLYQDSEQELSQHRTRCRPWADSVSHPFQVGLGKQLLGLSWT